MRADIMGFAQSKYNYTVSSSTFSLTKIICTLIQVKYNISRDTSRRVFYPHTTLFILFIYLTIKLLSTGFDIIVFLVLD